MRTSSTELKSQNNNSGNFEITSSFKPSGDQPEAIKN